MVHIITRWLQNWTIDHCESKKCQCTLARKLCQMLTNFRTYVTMTLRINARKWRHKFVINHPATPHRVATVPCEIFSTCGCGCKWLMARFCVAVYKIRRRRTVWQFVWKHIWLGNGLNSQSLYSTSPRGVYWICFHLKIIPKYIRL